MGVFQSQTIISDVYKKKTKKSYLNNMKIAKILLQFQMEEKYVAFFRHKLHVIRFGKTRQ